MPKAWRWTFILLFASLLLVVVANLQIGDDKLHLVICNVGQGDGILIYKKSTQIVMDGGPNDAILSCLSSHMPFWDRKIEAVIVTNPDADHYTGFINLFKRYKVLTYIAPAVSKDDFTYGLLEKEVEEAQKRGMRHIWGFEGQKETTSGITLTDIWPTREWFALEESKGGLEGSKGTSTQVLGTFTGKGKIVNELSLVYELQYGNFRALLTGDVQPPGTDMASSLIYRPVNVLKVPHHGSKNGLTKAMLDAARPELAVISVGKNNKFGHPNQETLDLLSGVKTLRTDQDGEVEIVTDGKVWKVR